jgi:hypothetical protein
VRLRSRETRRHLWTIDERTMSSNRITGTGRAGEFTEPIYAGPAGQRKWPEFTPGRVTISARALEQNQQATRPGQEWGPRWLVRDYGATSDQNTSTSKSPVDGSGSP